MIIQKTAIEGLYIIRLEKIEDERGYFMETFRRDTLYNQIGFDYQIKQMSQAFNNQKGILRGMHFQRAPHSEAKLVRCVRGAIYDVALDLRENSKTFGQWVAEKLTEDNDTLFFIPRGLAHGYQTLADDALVQYAIDETYHAEFSTGVKYDDPAFGISWPLENPILSEKDRSWPLFSR